jgi:hypothetical protein
MFDSDGAHSEGAEAMTDSKKLSRLACAQHFVRRKTILGGLTRQHQLDGSRRESRRFQFVQSAT